MARKKKKVTDETLDNSEVKETETSKENTDTLETTDLPESPTETKVDTVDSSMEGEEVKEESALSSETDENTDSTIDPSDEDVLDTLDGIRPLTDTTDSVVISAAPVATPPIKTTAAKEQSTEVTGDASLHGYIQSYLTLVQGSDINRTAKAFALLLQYVISKPTSDNIRTVHKFFIEYKNSILHESKALQGITMHSKPFRAKIELCYGVFKNLAGPKAKMDMDRVRKTLGEAFTTEIVKLSKA